MPNRPSWSPSCSTRTAAAAVGATLRAHPEGTRPTGDRPLQEPYSIRCVPHLMGAALSALNRAADVVDRDLNGVSDNPLFFPDDDVVAHGGNFFGQPVTFAGDLLSMTATQNRGIPRCHSRPGGSGVGGGAARHHRADPGSDQATPPHRRDRRPRPRAEFRGTGPAHRAPHPTLRHWRQPVAHGSGAHDAVLGPARQRVSDILLPRGIQQNPSGWSTSRPLPRRCATPARAPPEPDDEQVPRFSALVVRVLGIQRAAIVAR
nr:aromatic amino acid lyase [Lentzea xinjiangensis]